MKRYLEHMQGKDPHERRTHALAVAGAVTGLVFMVWITTLGVRLGGQDPALAQDPASAEQAAAAAQAAPQSGPRLEVSTTSVFLPSYSQ